MGEFKAQILGILLVLSVFGVLAAAVPSVFTTAWSAIGTKISDTITDTNAD